MSEGRKLRLARGDKPLAAGEKLQRDRLAAKDLPTWGWVKDVNNVSKITLDHLLATCDLGEGSSKPLCTPKYPVETGESSKSRQARPPTITPVEDDTDSIVVISDNEEVHCTKKGCLDNPNCLNHLGQEIWENEAKAREAFIKMKHLGSDPHEDYRDKDIPVGLKNLGATCYANAFLQVWFQNLAFRAGVYQCQSLPGASKKFEDSPIFQLQVTFASLQSGSKSVFNPVKLVESLQLRTSEQQDAQEFSKLFMSHLDSEFKKQSNPLLKTLLSDQFQGEQINVTICNQCFTRSEVKSSFLELEVHLEKDALLKDRIEQMLAPEKLTDDNKYLCAKCETLQDATRHSELRSLPPVLHISLLRFIYDLSTMERKKSKHTIRFPAYLDMQSFLQHPDSSQPSASDSCMYELRGVLLHKGTSAYHGHYEAQVYDMTRKKWFQFNDETVYPTRSFHDDPVPENSTENKKSKQRPPIKGQQGVSIGDKKDGNAKSGSIKSVSWCAACLAFHAENITCRYLKSKDAYMLIYARCEPSKAGQATKQNATPVNDESLDSTLNSTIPQPPPQAQEVVQRLNESHKKACADYLAKREAAEREFVQIRTKVRDIYQSWHWTFNRVDAVIVDQNALERWLTHWLEPPPKPAKSREPEKSEEGSAGTTVDVDENPSKDVINEELNKQSKPIADADFPASKLGDTFDNSGLKCKHGHLDPHKARVFKRLQTRIYQRIIDDTCCYFSPLFHPEDICRACVEEEYLERRYQYEHALYLKQFNQIWQPPCDDHGYWISKTWLKDWLQQKPKMHVQSRGDPSPDDPQFIAEVKCEHGLLSLKQLSRQKISYAARCLLQKLYPDFDPPPWDLQMCPTCIRQVEDHRQNRLASRKTISEEKSLFHRLQDEADFVVDTPCFIIEPTFLPRWRNWTKQTKGYDRPMELDNSCLVCEHGLLNVDPNNPRDIRDFHVVTLEEWGHLEKIYSAKPRIAISKVTDISDDVARTVFSADLETCDGCRRRRKLDVENGGMTIVLLKLRTDDIVPDGSMQLEEVQETITASTNGSQSTGIRQSKRLRNGKYNRNNRCEANVNKSQALLDIKLLIHATFGIPTISQRLFHRGKVLDDNTATISELEILSHDVVYVKEIEEDENVLNDSDSASGHPKKKTKEGEAFRGTILGGSPREPSASASEPAEESEHMDTDTTTVVDADSEQVYLQCPKCTFDNSLTAQECEMCGTLFE